MQVGATQRMVAVGQTNEAQSFALRQVRPAAQPEQLPPPQSTSLSVPLLRPSEQVLARHTPATQGRPAGQSTPTQAASAQALSTHTWPSAQPPAQSFA